MNDGSATTPLNHSSGASSSNQVKLTTTTILHPEAPNRKRELPEAPHGPEPIPHTPERKMARLNAALPSAPRAEGKSASAIRARTANQPAGGLRQPSFKAAQENEKKQSPNKQAAMPTTKMLPAHREEIPLARDGLHYSLTQTKEAMKRMRNAESFPALASLVAVTRGGRCYHHWDCRTLYYCNTTNPASGQVYHPTVRVVSFDEAADYGYQRCSSCIDALTGKMTITPRRRRVPASPAPEASPPNSEPRLHPRERAATRRAAAAPSQAPAAAVTANTAPAELEEGETSPPPYDSEEDEREISTNLQKQ